MADYGARNITDDEEFGVPLHLTAAALMATVVDTHPVVDVVSVDADATTLTITFDHDISVQYDAALLSKWLIMSPAAAAICTATALTINDDNIEVTLSGCTSDATYSVTIPFGVFRANAGTAFVGERTVTFTGVSTPVSIVMVRVQDGDEIDVCFSKQVIEVDALTTSNYTFDNNLRAISVTKREDTVYRVKTSDQTAGVSYTLTVANVRDLLYNVVE